MMQFNSVAGMAQGVMGGGAPGLPIKINEMFRLTNVGLNADLFKFGNLTLESEKYICVKDGNVSIFLKFSQSLKMAVRLSTYESKLQQYNSLLLIEASIKLSLLLMTHFSMASMIILTFFVRIV